MSIPSTINKITDGILVFPLIRSNRYENITNPLNMINVVYEVIFK